MRRPRLAALSAAVLLTVSLSACGGEDAPAEPSEETEPQAAGGVCAETDASGDLLAAVCEAGTLRVSTDPAYPPQSSLNEQTGEYEGFDIDVAAEIAKRLGVAPPAWETPDW